MRILHEFREFAVKGNVVDMAVGIIVGAAFTGIVSSLVSDIIMPPLGAITGSLDFKDKFLVLKAAADGTVAFASLAAAQQAGAIALAYGKFFSALIQFLIVSFTIFLMVRMINRLRRGEEKPGSAPVAKDCPQCAMSIPIKASRCPHCTSALAAAA